MSFITKLFGIDRRMRSTNTVLQSIQQQMARLNWQGPVYAAYDTTKLFKKAFEENAIYHAVVDRICEKFAHIPRYVYGNKKKSIDENIIEGELQQLLMQPNDMQGQDQFFYLVGLSFKTTGETFIWKNRGGIENGKPVELWVLPPWFVTVISDGSFGGVERYDLILNGNVIEFPKEDILHWAKPGLSTDGSSLLRGFNHLTSNLKVITQAESIIDASVAMYQQGGARGILANESLDNLDAAAIERIKDTVDAKINSNDVKGSVATIQGKWAYHEIGMSSVDLALLDADEAVIKKICFSLGFPYELFSGDATHANREQSLRYLLTQTISPMVASFDSELNRSLLPDFKEKGFIASDMSELPEMQAMRLEQAKAYQTMWELTPNQRLMLMGFEMSKDKAMDKVYAPANLVPIEDLGGDAIVEDDEDY